MLEECLQPSKTWEKSAANFSKDRCGGFKNELGIDPLDDDLHTPTPSGGKIHWVRMLNGEAWARQWF